MSKINQLVLARHRKIGSSIIILELLAGADSVGDEDHESVLVQLIRTVMRPE